MTVTRDIAVPRQRVWDVLADGWTYSGWVVGNSRIRAVDSHWPEPGSRILHSIGTWPAVINDEGAFAGDTSCAFKSRKQVAGAWQLVAACANARRRWTSHIRLAVTGNRLIWSSQRGLQTYVRCERGPMMAQASK